MTGELRGGVGWSTGGSIYATIGDMQGKGQLYQVSDSDSGYDVVELTSESVCLHCKRRYAVGDVITADFSLHASFHTDCADPKLENEAPVSLMEGTNPQ